MDTGNLAPIDALQGWEVNPRNIRHHLDGIYRSMVDCCYNNKSHAYKNYGGRGIKICELWREDKEEFFIWSINNGYQIGLTLDRKNNFLGYEPINCRWVTRSENSKNKLYKVTINADGRITRKCTTCKNIFLLDPTNFYRDGEGFGYNCKKCDNQRKAQKHGF